MNQIQGILRTAIMLGALAIFLMGCGSHAANTKDEATSNTPCSDIWVQGKTLPKNYSGCMTGNTYNGVMWYTCKGKQYTQSVDGKLFATKGGPIQSKGKCSF